MSLRRRVRQRATGLALSGLFHGVATLGRLHPRARPEAHGLEVLRDIPYADDRAPYHLLDVWRPMRRDGALPVVLYVHGGGFRILSKDTHWVMATAFARRGMVVFNINYRLAPRHPYPSAVEDASAALRWVADNAAAYGGDPNRIVLAGESAGANLVTGLTIASCYARPEPHARAVFDRDVRPIGVVPKCGIHEVSNIRRFRERNPRLPTFMADRMDQIAMDYFRGCDHMSAADLALANPVTILERGEAPDRPLPPFLLTCGNRDPIVEDTHRLAAALRNLGVPADAHFYDGEVHAFQAFVWRKHAQQAWQRTYEFLDGLGA